MSKLWLVLPRHVEEPLTTVVQYGDVRQRGEGAQLLLAYEAAVGVIARIWHGWTTAANADTYERLLNEEVLPGIKAKGVRGYRGIEVLRRSDVGEVEFVTIMHFDSIDAVRQFAGDDYERAYVPPRARELLSRFDERSQHYEVRDRPGA